MADSTDIMERLENIGCDREPFTPGHAHCVCRLANEARATITRLRSENAALMQCAEALRPFAQLAEQLTVVPISVTGPQRLIGLELTQADTVLFRDLCVQAKAALSALEQAQREITNV